MNKKLVDALLWIETIGGGFAIAIHDIRQQEVVEENGENDPKVYKALDNIGFYLDNMMKCGAWGVFVGLQKAAIYQKCGWLKIE